jgi:hypothetical protein
VLTWRTAEAALKLEEKKPRFSLLLLQIVHEESLPTKNRLSAALCFKNFIRYNYVVWILGCLDIDRAETKLLHHAGRTRQLQTSGRRGLDHQTRADRAHDCLPTKHSNTAWRRHQRHRRVRLLREMGYFGPGAL